MPTEPAPVVSEGYHWGGKWKGAKLEVVEFEECYAKATHASPISGKIGGRCILMGWSVRETSGAAPATVQVLNGQDAGGLEVLAAQLNPSGAARDWFGPQGIRTDVGIFPVITGTVAGALWIWRGFD